MPPETHPRSVTIPYHGASVPGPTAPPCPALSVIIVNWNTRNDLDRCLSSIEARRGDLDLEIIVIDNNSADGSAEFVQQRFPHVRLIANRDNRGFAGGNNQGLEIARGDYVLLLNPDTIVLDDVFTRAIEYAERHPDIGVLGCQVMDGPESIQPTCFRFPSPLNILMWVTGARAILPRSPIAGRAAYGDWDRTTTRDVDVVSGMFMLVRRDALDAIGLMDEGFFVFAEEADWCWRFRQAGWRCTFAPVGRILHVDGGSKSTAQASVRMYVEMQKNLLLFHRRNLGWLRWATAKVLFTASMTIRAALFGAWSRLRPRRATSSKATLAAAAARFHWTGKEPGW